MKARKIMFVFGLLCIAIALPAQAMDGSRLRGNIRNRIKTGWQNLYFRVFLPSIHRLAKENQVMMEEMAGKAEINRMRMDKKLRGEFGMHVNRVMAERILGEMRYRVDLPPDSALEVRELVDSVHESLKAPKALEVTEVIHSMRSWGKEAVPGVGDVVYIRDSDGVRILGIDHNSVELRETGTAKLLLGLVNELDPSSDGQVLAQFKHDRIVKAGDSVRVSGRAVTVP